MSTTTTHAINREPQRMATGVQAAPTPTDHNTACPGSGASKKIMAVAIAICQTARSPKQHENRGIDRKYRGYAQDVDSCAAVAVPRVTFRAPSAHARDAKSGRFLACAAKKKRGCRRRARDDACRRSRLLSSVFVTWSFCDTLHFSDFLLNDKKIRTWSPMGPKLVFFPSNPIKKLNWIHFFSSLEPALIGWNPFCFF